ncbi:helix-turn-helix domain-containing protein [Streptomyces sp. NPDC006294]|uniref:helix-turn-helix domain-containing protein n=1 Tax=Streptomyces sp. NPDC006294 TaxID=3364743 RepID=UPI0036859037
MAPWQTNLGRTLRRLRRLAALTQEEPAERSGVSVDVIRQLGQRRKHSARLPTLHALANGLGVELTTLRGGAPRPHARALGSGARATGARLLAGRTARADRGRLDPVPLRRVRHSDEGAAGLDLGRAQRLGFQR